MLKLIMDTHIHKQIALQLRDKGLDVVRLEEIVELENNASDEEILEYACANSRAVLSLDSDFRDLHYHYLLENKTHYGIFLGNQDLQGAIGFIVNHIMTYAEVIDDMANMKNQLIEFRRK